MASEGTHPVLRFLTEIPRTYFKIWAFKRNIWRHRGQFLAGSLTCPDITTLSEAERFMAANPTQKFTVAREITQ
jgi:hypothetical protein